MPITYFLNPLMLRHWSFFDAELDGQNKVILIMPKSKVAKPGEYEMVQLRDDYYVC